MVPFSDLMLLGSILLRPVPFVRDDGKGGGCALGMAQAAAGNLHDPQALSVCWPWLALPVPELPCDSAHSYFKDLRLLEEDYPDHVETIVSTIAHIFNQHVFGDRTWTLERLADWVRQVEPQAEPVSMLDGHDVGIGSI